MDIRILMTGNHEQFLSIDQELLHERGFKVYKTLSIANIEELVAEVRPDLIFLNYRQPNDEEIVLYHTLLDNVRIASIPIIFTLSEDDVYLVNRKRTASKEKRNIIADSVINAVRMAFTNTKSSVPHVPVDLKKTQYPHFRARA